MSSDKSDEVIDKLDKVADNLETATSQLSGVVTQQQLDLLRERVTSCEAGINATKSSDELSGERSAEHFDQIDSEIDVLKTTALNLEKDLSGLRALALTGFALATISMIALVLCIAYL